MIQEIIIDYKKIRLGGHISGGRNPKSWIIFAHGSGSSRKSPRNNWVAKELNQLGHATFLFDLLTPEEDLIFENRFNLPLLAERLLIATDWLRKSTFYQQEPLAYFGASTGAGAALIAAAELSHDAGLFTVISRGGRPDLAGESALQGVRVPVLLIVGSLDHEVIKLNQMAKANLSDSELKLVEGATHLFEEPGKLAEVVSLCGDWIDNKLNIQQGGDHAVT